MVPERPRRRQRGRAGQRRPGQQHARGGPHRHPAPQRTAVHPQHTPPRPVVPGTRPLLALAQRHRAVPRRVVEDQMRPRVGHHQLHGHRDGRRVRAGGGRRPRAGVPQAVRAVAQPGPHGPPTESEEPRVGRHLRPLRPARRPAVDRLPPAGRQLTTQDDTPGRAHLHRTVAGHGHRHPLRHHPPAAVLVRLQHRPRIRLGTAARQRVGRLRPGAVPPPEHGTVHRDEDAQLRPLEPDHTAPGAGHHLPHHPRNPRPLRTPPGQRGGIGTPTAPRRPHRTQPLRHPRRTDRLHRTHQVTTVHADHPAIDDRARGRRSTAVHPVPDHIFVSPTV